LVRVSHPSTPWERTTGSTNRGQVYFVDIIIKALVSSIKKLALSIADFGLLIAECGFNGETIEWVIG